MDSGSCRSLLLGGQRTRLVPLDVSTMTPLHATEREKKRAILILALNALADALWKNERIKDDGIGLQALRKGATEVTEILRGE